MWSKKNEQLKFAFPSQYAEDVSKVIAFLDGNNLELFELSNEIVEFEFENLTIPYRISIDFSDDIPTNNLTPTQQAIYWSVLTRHPNGFYRQFALEKLFLSKNTFSEVYELLLLGEYVREIVEVIYEYSSQEKLKKYASVFKHDPLFANKIKGRVASSWGKAIRSKYSKGNRIYRKYKGRLLLVELNRELNKIEKKNA
jgi:hypothetical protein